MKDKNVLITIKNTQQPYNDEAITFEPEVIEIITKGKLRTEKNAYTLTYEERFSNQKRVTVLNFSEKYKEKTILINKDGNENTMLIINEGKRINCWYNTDYGGLQIGVCGEMIKSKLGKDGGNLEFHYKIDINSIATSSNKVQINFKYC
ncbi:MAG: DUF1934 domain-containing protein [Oscillospiraceae bacterium]|jgi:uncharacterized beta-barrel protein YwiB (DUF1934 family)|nr:DUF1934 domain-containing protein [Oscillospiraceae bacterium]